MPAKVQQYDGKKCAGCRWHLGLATMRVQVAYPDGLRKEPLPRSWQVAMNHFFASQNRVAVRGEAGHMPGTFLTPLGK